MTDPAGAPDLAARAEALARTHHAGQVDKQGRAYAEHHLAPIAALLEPFGPDAVAAGWLHDIVEDTAITPDDLAGEGIPPVVVDAVLSVTRREEETYDELITRACADRLGRLVKLMDNWVNLTGLGDLAVIDPDRAATLRARYEGARVRLLDAIR